MVAPFSMATRKIQLLCVVCFLICRISCVVHPDGVSKVSHYQDDLGNYEFGYTVSSSEGEHFHKSEKDALGRVVGSYGLTGNDGRQRIVDYVADHNGFRAHVRSNEPGLASSSSAAVTVEKTGPDNSGPISHLLDFAASSDTGSKFGERLKETSSRVAYSRPGEDEQHRSEQRRRFRLPNNTLRVEPLQSPRLSDGEYLSAAPEYVRERLAEFPQTRAALRDSPVFSRYQPPIDPFSSGQLIPPPVNPLRQHRSRQEIIQPSTPPYGGIETRNPLLDPVLYGRFPSVTEQPGRNEVTRRPVVSMSTIHGGIGDMSYLLNPTSPRTPVLRSRTGSFPSTSTSSRDGFLDPRYQLNRPPNSVGSRQNLPPNLVLRAVAIPNGIQAVHVDPATGEVYNNPEYPVYNPEDVTYDDDTDERSPGNPYGGTRNSDYGGTRNSDFGGTRNSDYGDTRNSDYGDSQFLRNPQPYRPLPPPPLRSRNAAPSNYSFSSIPVGYNHRDYRKPPDIRSLSKPSAKDLQVISRVFEHMNQRYNIRHPTGPVHRPNNIPYVHDSRPDYPRAAVHPSDVDFDFDDFRSGPATRLGPRQLSSIFPLTFAREPFGPEYPRFDDRNYGLNRGYRHVGDEPENKDNTSSSNKENDSRSK